MSLPRPDLHRMTHRDSLAADHLAPPTDPASLQDDQAWGVLNGSSRSHSELACQVAGDAGIV